MAYLEWREGPKQYGCVYHKRAVRQEGSDDIVIDVFVMPAIRDARPIALTVGRYRNYQKVEYRKAGFRNPGPEPGRLEKVSEMLDEIGVNSELSAYLADEVDQFLVKEAEVISEVLEIA